MTDKKEDNSNRIIYSGKKYIHEVDKRNASSVPVNKIAKDIAIKQTSTTPKDKK